MNRLVLELRRRCSGTWALTVAVVVGCAGGTAAADLYVDCRPDNASGSQYTSISAAVADLNALPATADWDTIHLMSDCTDNLYLTRSRIRITAGDECPWNGCGNTGARITAQDTSSAVITVDGPHDIQLVHLTLSGGRDGLIVTSGGSVTVYGVVAEKSVGDPSAGYGNGFHVDVGSFLNMGEGGAVNNAGYGIYLGEGSSATFFGNQSWLQGEPLVISGNGLAGIRAERTEFVSWAGVTIERNGGWGLLLLGAHGSFGSIASSQSLVRDNPSGGAFLAEGSEASFWGRTSFQNNGPYGVYLDSASSAHFDAAGGMLPSDGKCVLVEGHTEVGVNVTTNGHVSFNGPHVVRNNGAAGKAWSAGVRVDGGSQAYFGKGFVGVPTEVTDNSGPGILVDLGSVLEVPTASIQDNSMEAVRVYHQSTAYLGPQARLQPNGGAALRCDATSLVVTDRAPKSLSCLNVEKPTGPRPTRPEPFR